MENEGSSSVVASSTPDGTVGWIESMIVTASQTSVGQSLFKLVESFLWVVEKSARWSVPTHELSAGKIHAEESQAIEGVKLEGNEINEAQNARQATPDEKSTTESAGSPTPIEPKRKISQVSSADESTDDATDESKNETLQSMIDRLANDDSTDDPDFNPPDCSTESNTSSENEAEHNVTLSELEDVQKEAEEILKNHKLRLALIGIIAFVEQFQKTNDKETKEETTNRVARVDSPGESVYLSARECDDDEEAPFYSPPSWRSGSPVETVPVEPVVHSSS
ncbi:hypothetical protein WN55_04976 [Dufourea novaeangliae]|uniref:Uncharacterized protein n=1 Tax=Dufourea novaeangliae TaxID=178035 RepID=A0A154PNH7_DUFNO|nr:hypothetical protein WN55_04976 [Dufourea novaeangliae]